MDTKLTKKYTIIFLLILNIVLLVINILTKDIYVINKQQKDIILSYIQEQNIELETNMLTKYYPMPKLNMKKAIYNENMLKNMFFNVKKEIDRQEDFENVVLSQDKKSLTINKFFVYFQDLNVPKDFSYDENFALKVAKKYKKIIQKKYGKLYFDKVQKINDSIQVSYLQKDGKYSLFNNVLKVNIYKDGTMDLVFNFYKKIDDASNKIDICSPDEALYTFTNEIKKLIPDKKITITSMDLGYYFKDYNDDISFSFNPYYRFCIDNDSIFYINAYTNTFEYESSMITKEKIF